MLVDVLVLVHDYTRYRSEHVHVHEDEDAHDYEYEDEYEDEKATSCDRCTRLETFAAVLDTAYVSRKSAAPAADVP